MGVSLKDVAQRAGVSIKTVSNVVNNYQHVTPKMRAKVQQAIDELGYRPNLTAPGDRRTLELWTTEPGLQIYTANQLDGAFTDGTGRRHRRHGSLCLETQHLPDSPNRPGHPSTVLRPGAVLRSRTEWRFPHLRAR